MPYLYPSSIHEIIEMGLLGIAMSRYSGCWVGMKTITETVETTAEIDLNDEMRQFIIPTDFELPPGGLNLRWPDDRFAQDRRLQDYKGYAAIAFARANKVDRITMDSPKARFGIMASGKAYEDVRQALRELGIDRAGRRAHRAQALQGRHALAARAGGRAQFRRRPRRDSHRRGAPRDHREPGQAGAVQLARRRAPAHRRQDGRPRQALPAVRRRDRRRRSRARSPTGCCDAISIPRSRRLLRAKADWFDGREASQVQAIAPVVRTPYFCSGCPHNTSTKVPEGSRALAGIGCHFMALWMDRNTETFTQMGGEGVPWVGIAPFTNEKHIFANLGDGTYFHSGSLAIRQAVASEGQHHLQDPLQRRGRDDRRPARRRRSVAAADHLPAARRGRARRSISSRTSPTRYPATPSRPA